MSTKFNLANTRFAFPDAEAGVMLEGLDQEFSTDELWQRDHTGDETGVVFFNTKMTGSLKGKIAGTTGLAVAAPATSLTIANLKSAHGVTAGLVLCSKVRISRTNTTLEDIAIDFSRRAGITS